MKIQCTIDLEREKFDRGERNGIYIKVGYNFLGWIYSHIHSNKSLSPI